MAAIKLHVLKPSVNNMAARVFVRAAGLDFTEDDVYGKTRTEEFLAKNPAHLTPMIEAEDLPKGVVWESCAIMQYCATAMVSTASIPRPQPRVRWSTARCSISSGHFIPTLRGDLSRAWLPAISRRSRGERGRRSGEGYGPESGHCRDRRAIGRVSQILHGRKNVHWRRRAIHRRHPARGHPRVSSSDRLSAAILGKGLYAGDGSVAWPCLCGACGRCPGIYRLREIPEKVRSVDPTLASVTD